jgi:hypothetical protein
MSEKDKQTQEAESKKAVDQKKETGQKKVNAPKGTHPLRQ